jgi:hypothetical protein
VRMSTVMTRVEQARSPGRRERARLRRRLADQDRLSARLAELARIRDLVAVAREVVAAGWAQDSWFVRRDDHGRQYAVDLREARRTPGGPVDRACLVGAILQAGGGVANADAQVVQRTFDLTWHTLHRGDHVPVQWCPAPPVRAQQVRDLVRWNDEPGRRRGEVEALLRSVERAAGTELAREHAPACG